MAIALQHIFISIHALREEGDHILPVFPQQTARFLSTPSARRATQTQCNTKSGQSHFYPRPPRGGRLYNREIYAQGKAISIHALREEGDTPASRLRPWYTPFLSTPSARRATDRSHQLLTTINISIHALREEGDRLRVAVGQCVVISIHALREEGDIKTKRATATSNQFLSTPSARRATFLPGSILLRALISIHALREEGDGWTSRRRSSAGLFLSTPSARRATQEAQQPARQNDYFYPRPPRGGRPSERRAARTPLQISIHALREEGDRRLVAQILIAAGISIHALREEGDRRQADRPAASRISIHALREEGDADQAQDRRE